MKNQEKIRIIIDEKSGVKRFREPVTVGIPFPRGMLVNENNLSVIDSDNNPISLQEEVLATWPDQSIKWLLLDFMVDCPKNKTVYYYLKVKGESTRKNEDHKIKVSDVARSLIIDTGKAVFGLDKKVFHPLSVKVLGVEMIDNCSAVLKDDSGAEFRPVVSSMGVETKGWLRTTVKIEGRFLSKNREKSVDFLSRLSFYVGTGLVRTDFTIRNPKAAKHPGGLWDLGDKGSIYFNDLSFQFSLSSRQDTSIFWKTQIGQEEKKLNGKRVKIYQDSSGGENWDSPNHVNRYGKVMNTFRGYKIMADSVLEEGQRANPTICVSSPPKNISAAIQNFWQNFPKSMGAENNVITLRLFPEQYNDLFELQGGEQKTHTFYLNFGDNLEETLDLDWIYDPLVPTATPEWYAESKAIGYLAPQEKDKNLQYQKLIDTAIEGKESIFAIREKADEYGWRHFGDIFANHEIVRYKGSLFPFVSHFNNQYDVVNGCILQYARTGHWKWFQVMIDLTKHVIDIDIYHTQKDSSVFNGGSFWHTDHFMHAETSTHRSYSKVNAEKKGVKSYGGGPSAENCYTTGLRQYYYLTGDVMAKESVLELAEWIINAGRLGTNPLEYLKKAKRTVSSLLDKYSNTPGRAQGNSLNALLDAFDLIKDQRYITRAESIIKRYISPLDNIDNMNKQKLEKRFFYLIFLQSLGKYLDMKAEMSQKDKMFNYAKDSLLHHAKWMLKNEVLYKQLFHIAEIPSSTWCAQDIRKSVIFDFAFKYSDEPLKRDFKERSEHFFNGSIADVLSFNDESKTFIRPLTILMNYGVMHTYLQSLD